MILVSVILITGVIVLLKFIAEKTATAISTNRKVRYFISVVVIILVFALSLLGISSLIVQQLFSLASISKIFSSLPKAKLILVLVVCYLFLRIGYPLAKKRTPVNSKQKKFLKSLGLSAFFVSLLLAIITDTVTTTETLAKVSIFTWVVGAFILFVVITLVWATYIDYSIVTIEKRVTSLCDNEIFLERVNKLNKYGSFTIESCEVDQVFLADIDFGIYHVKSKKDIVSLKCGETADVFISKEVIDMVASMQKLENYNQGENNIFIEYFESRKEKRIAGLRSDEIFLSRIEKINEYGSFVAESCEISREFLFDVEFGIYEVANEKAIRNLKQGEKIDVFVPKKIIDMVTEPKKS